MIEPSKEPPAPPVAASPDPDDAEDRRLVALIQSLSAAQAPSTHPELALAWRSLCARYQDRLYATCVRMLSDRDHADDLVQDVFVKLLRSLSTYDGRAKVSTWITRIAINACLSARRSARLRAHQSLDAPTQSSSSGNRSGPVAHESSELAPARGVLQDDERLAVVRALDRLDPEQRALLVLRDVQDLDYLQIADVLNVPVGTVKSRLFRARAALREILEASNHPDSVRP